MGVPLLGVMPAAGDAHQKLRAILHRGDTMYTGYFDSKVTAEELHTVAFDRRY